MKKPETKPLFSSEKLKEKRAELVELCKDYAEMGIATPIDVITERMNGYFENTSEMDLDDVKSLIFIDTTLISFLTRVYETVTELKQLEATQLNQPETN